MACGCSKGRVSPKPSVQTQQTQAAPVRVAPPQNQAQVQRPAFVPPTRSSCWKCKVGVLQIVKPAGKVPEYLRCTKCGAIFAKGR